MIKSLTINKFRQFTKSEIYLGNYLTCIAGKNATGKSSILAMIGNSCELVPPRNLKPFIKKSFRSDFSDIFKGSMTYDPSASNLFRVNFKEGLTEYNYRDFRVTWQKKRNGGDERRFRVIPYYKDDKGKTHSKKAELPVIYLTLSRLLPFGEIEESKPITMNLSEDEKSWFNEKYQKIFTPLHTINSLDSYLGNNKTSVGINTDFYDSKNNSAGQDNLGQLLLVLISFMRLKKQLVGYKGGILLIDEIDAALHPYAQIKLIDLLTEFSRKYQIQIIFTTHSPTILKELSSKIQYNDERINNNIEIIYLSNSNRKLELIRNPSYDYIESDLFITDMIRRNRKITCYSEDEETRWFTKELFPIHTTSINFVNIKMGCENLLQLDKHDFGYFSNILFVFDGDFEEELKKDSYNLKDHYEFNNYNKFVLPGPFSPEKLLYLYLMDLDPEHEVWQLLKSKHMTYESIVARGPYSDDFKSITDERLKFKNWFNIYRSVFEEIGLVKLWKRDNSDIFNDYEQKFIAAYNHVAKKTLMPSITS